MIPDSLRSGLHPAIVTAIDFALTNIGVCEDPPGSNRGPEIDRWTKEAGAPLGSPWCAIAAWKASKTGGLWVPSQDVASCDEWFYQAERKGLCSKTPVIGARVLYTNGKQVPSGRYAGRPDAVHIGIIERVSPKLLSIEGNTTLGKYDREGYLQTVKEVDASRVLTYVLPGV